MSIEVSDVLPVVLDAWERTLGLDGIRRDDNFFELGGDSITAIRIVPLVSDATGVDLDAMAVFDHPTPQEMAEGVVSLLKSA
ncbi:acyl carrier protein [Solwaraspora sp. WMMD1047]|uniref:acyl carrier protein n=1 Tax=Solwaraspora sp. WMMD1047 TaxID=3016102 RepID=UPI002415B78A|nr:acyl carrier protein [Solwaraspora sp. WMMD1047]MDG4829275.1 acyl carrier protein [Solwaraspora sp. WMMD1047]